MSIFGALDEKGEKKSEKKEENIKIELYKNVPKEAYMLIEEVLRYVGTLEKKSNIE